MKDNDGDDLMWRHSNFIDTISVNKHLITGFTRYQAEGFWFDSDKVYKDDIKIYEFHVSNKNVGVVYKLLQQKASDLRFKMKQECIYLQLNNETELVR